MPIIHPFLSLHKSQKLFLDHLGVYVAQIDSVAQLKILRLSRREQLIMLEIGDDRIDTASSFVDYMHENYGFSKSSVWYCLKGLKEAGMADFANKAEQGKPLELTRNGRSGLAKIEPSRSIILAQFSNSFLETQKTGLLGRNYAARLNLRTG